jgi:hypothetical protein
MRRDGHSTTRTFDAVVQPMGMGRYQQMPDAWSMYDSGFDPGDSDGRYYMLWSEFLGVIHDVYEIDYFIGDGKTGKDDPDYYGVVTSMQFDPFVLQSQETDPFNFWGTLGAIGELLNDMNSHVGGMKRNCLVVAWSCSTLTS